MSFSRDIQHVNDNVLCILRVDEKKKIQHKTNDVMSLTI